MFVDKGVVPDRGFERATDYLLFQLRVMGYTAVACTRNLAQFLKKGLAFVGLALAAAASSAPAQAPAQDRSQNRVGALAGVIRDSLGGPLSGATIQVAGPNILTVSDDSGRFFLAGIPVGRHELRIKRIGYLPAAFEAHVGVDTTVLLQIRLRAVTTLPDVVTLAPRVSSGLARVGFYERERHGLGKFVRPESVDSLAFVSRPSEMLRNVNGLDIRCSGAKGCSVLSRAPPYCLHVFVDGHPVSGADGPEDSRTLDEILTPGVIAAFEIYRHPSEVPTQFQGALPQKRGRGMTVQAGCGALVVWTKSRM